jgi:hypothetical protein
MLTIANAAADAVVLLAAAGPLMSTLRTPQRRPVNLFEWMQILA